MSNLDDLIDKHRGLPGEITTQESGHMTLGLSDDTIKKTLHDRASVAEKLSFDMIKKVARITKDMEVDRLDLVYQILDSGENFQGLRFLARGNKGAIKSLGDKCGDGFELLVTQNHGDLEVLVLRQWQGGFVADVYTKNRTVAKSLNHTPDEWLTTIIDSRATKVMP